MKFDHRTFASVWAAMLTGTLGLSNVHAGCPCNQGGGAISGGASAPIPMSPYINAPVPTGMPAAVPPAGEFGNVGPTGVGPGYSAATATSWQPPPGTIGQTYQMKSRPVPVKMHPRAAIVDVRIPDAKNVRVHDMNVYRTQDFLEGFQDDQDPSVWHFTSEPLIPGIPHIYRIEARVEGPDGEEKMEERWVRLIMGRVIEVSF
ncbi:hypothetical protein SH661x_000154 [Planctomicrobium sp. SH661]|uniref:hypothetical protein n=1 Tax=Planctomicrobium sp. SH661 TaxID=3448124 RepID=UPI003F5B95D6